MTATVRNGATSRHNPSKRAATNPATNPLGVPSSGSYPREKTSNAPGSPLTSPARRQVELVACRILSRLEPGSAWSPAGRG